MGSGKPVTPKLYKSLINHRDLFVASAIVNLITLSQRTSASNSPNIKTT